MNVSSEKPPHPGQIQIVDGRSNRVVDQLDASKVPDALRYAETENGWAAVTRIVELTDGARLAWRAFTADGQMVRSGTANRR